MHAMLSGMITGVRRGGGGGISGKTRENSGKLGRNWAEALSYTAHACSGQKLDKDPRLK